MSGRGAGLVVMALGSALAVLPAFTWYTVERADGEVRASGFGGAGQLLLMPVIGAIAVLAGAALVSARGDARRATAIRTGVIAAAAGLIGLAFTVWAAVAPGVELRASLPDGTEVVPATVEVAAAAAVAPVVAGTLALVGGWLAWSAARPR